MVTNEKIEEYLIDTDLDYKAMGEGLWLLLEDNLVINHTPPVIIFRVKLMDLEKDVTDAKRLEVFKYLLELNASDMVAGAYGLEDDAVVIIDSLQSENLDYNEFQASLESMSLSIRQHYEQLRAMLPAPAPVQEEELSIGELEASIRQAT